MLDASLMPGNVHRAARRNATKQISKSFNASVNGKTYKQKAKDFIKQSEKNRNNNC